MICSLCPRLCRAVRTSAEGAGFCHMPLEPVLARAGLHMWEEPCISGSRGSGAVFFSGCTLLCGFCQNEPISHGGVGKLVSTDQLREIFHRLIAEGAHNINLVTPTQFTHAILKALCPPISVPIVWNSNGYERVASLRALEGKIQIYLPDFKYADNTLALRCSGVGDYFEVATAAISEMVRQTGPFLLNEEGILERGVMIRHLMLPGQLPNTKRVIDWVSNTFPPDTVLFSLMGQYVPMGRAAELGLNRRITPGEYRAAIDYLSGCGIQAGYLQELDAASLSYIPAFDGSGL